MKMSLDGVVLNHFENNLSALWRDNRNLCFMNPPSPPFIIALYCVHPRSFLIKGTRRKKRAEEGGVGHHLVDAPSLVRIAQVISHQHWQFREEEVFFSSSSIS